MTLVDVCGTCDTLFVEGEEHCRYCGADRADAVKREMRELCCVYSGEAPGEDEITRMVKPVFDPKWGKAQWYEGDGDGSEEGSDEDERDRDGEGG